MYTASVAAARSLVRSAASRTVRMAGVASGTRVSRSTRPSFRISKQNSLSNRMLRSPVELSCCVETMIPYHTATASTLLTSMLYVSRRSYGWNPEDG